MKPLSALNYSRNNKRKLVTSIISIMVAVSFLFVLQTFIKSIYITLNELNTNAYNIHIKIYSVDKDHPIPEKIISEIENSPDVDKIIPFIEYSTRYTIPASLTGAEILSVRANDMEYLMQKHKTTLKAGRLPREENKEVALDSRVAKNKNVKIGDKIGNSVLKNDSLDGEYTVVGLLDGENFISIMPYSITAESINSKEMSLLQKSALIFPKENKLSQVEELVNSYPRNEIHILTLKDTIEIINQRSMSILNTLDMVCIIAIVVMVISVGSSKFVQFYNRKQEFGVLNALGYTKLEIMKKTFMEILLINSLGFFIGLGFGLLLSFLISMAIFESVGAIPVVFCFKALFISLFIPLFTALFTLVPVNRMINSLDPIVMIEGI